MFTERPSLPETSQARATVTKEEKASSGCTEEIISFGPAPRLQAAILFFLEKSPGRLNRISLCKQLYYADGHFYQKYARTMTEFPYLHIEGSPQPMFFNEIMHQLVCSRQLEVIPDVVSQQTESGPIMVLKGLTYKTLVTPPNVFSKEEKKVLMSVAATFGGDLALETRYYPNLFQLYAQTGLYETIGNMQFPDGKRPHLSWKAWATKIFRLKWQ